MKRHKMNSRHAKRSFSKSASYVHKKNLISGAAVLQRGGIRM